jgi:UDP-xylose/UDP-N-acetylglucosamine transporter B4
LIVNMFMGWLLLSKRYVIGAGWKAVSCLNNSHMLLLLRYSTGQVLAVILVTVGVIWATMATTNVESKVWSLRELKTFMNCLTNNYKLQKDSSASSNFSLGIAILSIAMVLSACLGLLQEVTYRKYGKAWREGLFYTVSYRWWCNWS